MPRDGSRSFRIRHRNQSAARAARAPTPIMRRNDQYATGMFGVQSPGPNCCSYWAWRSLIPSTLPFGSPVAMNERRYGIRIEKTSSVPSSEPIVKMENEAGCEVSQSASADAIFIGCTSVMIRAWRSPVTVTRSPETTSIQAPTFAAVR